MKRSDERAEFPESRELHGRFVMRIPYEPRAKVVKPGLRLKEKTEGQAQPNGRQAGRLVNSGPWSQTIAHTG